MCKIKKWIGCKDGIIRTTLGMRILIIKIDTKLVVEYRDSQIICLNRFYGDRVQVFKSTIWIRTLPLKRFETSVKECKSVVFEGEKCHLLLQEYNAMIPPTGL